MVHPDAHHGDLPHGIRVHRRGRSRGRRPRLLPRVGPEPDTGDRTSPDGEGSARARAARRPSPSRLPVARLGFHGPDPGHLGGVRLRIGRAHHLMMFPRLLEYMHGHDAVYFATLSDLYDIWTD